MKVKKALNKQTKVTFLPKKDSLIVANEPTVLEDEDPVNKHTLFDMQTMAAIVSSSEEDGENFSISDDNNSDKVEV